MSRALSPNFFQSFLIYTRALTNVRMPPLSGRAIIVTGGRRGIGAAIVSACLDAGARVVSGDVLPPSPASPPPAGLVEVVADVSCAAGHASLVQACLAAFGRLDGLVNNAGINFCKPFLSTTEAEYDRLMAVDLRGLFFLTQAAVRHAVASSAPLSIVNIASVHALQGVAGAGPYDAAKAGVVGLTRALAVELAPMRCRVNAVSPGLVDTEIWRTMLAATSEREACERYWMAQIPGARAIDAAEVAGPVVFLLSDAASGVTGANFVVDAGMTAQLVATAPFHSEAYDDRGPAEAEAALEVARRAAEK